MAFTTWSQLKTDLLDDLSGSSFMTKSYTLPGGGTRVLRSLTEYKEFLQYIELRIKAESPRRARAVVEFG